MSACGLGSGPHANPVPEQEWLRMLGQPGRYLRGPSEETRREVVWTLSQGYLDVYLVTPDTLSLIVRNPRTFAPLFVAAQTIPYVPNPKLQAWFRAVLIGHRAAMINALESWLTPGSDSIAPVVRMHRVTFSEADRWLDFAGLRSSVALSLADWNAREALPKLRALRTRLVDEAQRVGADPQKPLEQLDDAIRRLEGRPGSAPLEPDGKGGFVAGRHPSQVVSATVVPGSSLSTRTSLLDPAEREALWTMVAAARETVFIPKGGGGSIELRFEDGIAARILPGSGWGELEFEQYPYPLRWLRDEALYRRFLSLTEGVPPRSVVASIRTRARFRREHVLLAVDGDSIRVEGHYVFLSDDEARPFAVRFPAVRAPDLPWFREWSAQLEDPRPGEMILPLNYTSADSGFVIFPAAATDTIRVLAASEAQLLHQRRVVYLLTTTRAWREPLDHTVLEVDWPDSLGPPRFSLPFAEAAHSGRRTRYRYEASHFEPDTDLVVTW